MQERSTHFTLDGFSLELVCENKFSIVYRGHHESLQEMAVKVASDAGTENSSSGPLDSRAIGFITGGTSEIEPDRNALLRYQAERLTDAPSSATAKCIEVNEANGRVYCLLEWIPNRNLRQQIGSCDPAEVIAAVLHAYLQLEEDGFGSHGDIKPENVLLGGGCAKFIDPGFFGAIQSIAGNQERCAITTPYYYPLLVPDDLLAIGILCWEVFLGHHPLLYGAGEDAISDPKRHGKNLIEWITERERIGQYFLTGLYALPHPKECNPKINDSLARYLLACLRLAWEGGQLDKKTAFSSARDMLAALNSLQN